MADRQYEFELPRGLSPADLIGRLEGQLRLVIDAPEVRERTWLDSFDWRLYGAGSALVAECDADGPNLRWQELASGRLLGSQRVAEFPRMVWDLEPGALREQLGPILEMRALLPQATEHSRGQALHVVNKDRKTVLRLFVEDSTARSPDGETSVELGASLRLVPVKGYPKPLARVLKLLESELGLLEPGASRLERILAALGRRPGDYSSKLNLSLHDEMDAGEATRTILLELLDTLERNESGTRENLDTEFLHDLRVAVRRTRSALGQIKGVMHPQALEHFKAEFGWLGQMTGPTRDLDVYLLCFDDYRSGLSPTVAADLEPLRAFLEQHHAIEQKALAETLESERYRKLVRDWRAFVEHELVADERLPSSRRAVRELANDRIWRVYRLVLKEGRAITPASPAEDLHELRKTCKKLRYLMEFFQSLYPENQLKVLIKVLKDFQENLGAFQDYEVQAATLKRFSQQMMEEGRVSAGTLMAMGILVDGLERRQHAAREEFAGRFAHFSLPENRRRFSELFAPTDSEHADT